MQSTKMQGDSLQNEYEILNTISKDEHAIAKYRARRKWEADLTTNLSVSRRLGKEEGRQEGILIGMERGMESGSR